MADLKWQAPTEQARQQYRSRYADVAAALKERPGEWALVREGAPGTSYVTQIRAALTKHGGTFEVTSRRANDAGTFDIFARCVEVGAA